MVRGGDIDYPKTFNEKLQWLKLNHRDKDYIRYADKYLVRQHVEATIGAKYLNDLYALYDSVQEVIWDELPNAFAMKATHGSGMNILVKDKATENRCRILKIMDKWLHTVYSSFGREWVYQDIQPRIIIEKLILTERGQFPEDYKVFCFNGTPTYIQVDTDRFGLHRRSFYDTHWLRQPFALLYEAYPSDIPRPKYLDEMLTAAAKLASNIPFVRVDFYALPQPMFGEMTFYPENAVGRFYPPEWDLRLGEQLNIPDRCS